MKNSVKMVTSIVLRRVLLAPLCLIVAGLMVMSPILNTDFIRKQIKPLVPETEVSESKEISEAQKQNISEQYGKLPLSFEINQGQTDSRVKFLSRGSGYSLFLTPTEAVLSLSRSAPAGKPGLIPSDSSPTVTKNDKSEIDVVRMKLLGANPSPEIKGQDEMSGKTNYFIGNDSSKWKTNVSHYAKVKYEKVYPGVDMVYYGNQRQLEYDFILEPGADPNQIRLGIDGADQIRIDESGDLVLSTKGGDVRQHKPLIYQETEGNRRAIEGSYVVKSQGQVGFEVGGYDQNLPLVIDPILVYSTYLGGTTADYGRGIAVDDAGNAYVTGYTVSTNFPIKPGAVRTALTGVGSDAFVTKLDANGTTILYSTFLGGSSFDDPYGIVVDGAGNAFVAGYTESADFPTTPGSFQTSRPGGGADAFVTKLGASGSALIYSTYVGGSSDTEVGPVGIDVDSTGCVYITGTTRSADFPTTIGAIQQIHGGGVFDAFVTKLDVAGATLLYSTYLGGSNFDIPKGIAVDSLGSAYVTGYTQSADFPTSPGAFQTPSGGNLEVFVTKLDSNASALIYSTYLGGSSNDFPSGIAVDGAGDAFVTGQTSSTNFPTTPGALRTIPGGLGDAFVTKLGVDGSTLDYSTYLGGSGTDTGYGIAVDATGNAFVTGATSSSNFPTTLGAVRTTRSGNDDAFVTKLDATGSSLGYSTYIGGFRSDYGQGIAVDGTGNIFVTGITGSTNFRTTPGSVQITSGGFDDAFVIKIGEAIGPDNDGDGIPDSIDNCTTPNTDQADFDGDQQGDVCDADDDNDGVPDISDAFPFDSSESIDTDGDSIGNNADTDDDNDGQMDANELACGSNPLNALSMSPDGDQDNIPNCVDSDDDNDGQTDVNELACGSDPLNALSKSTDSDNDNIPNCVDPTPFPGDSPVVAWGRNAEGQTNVPVDLIGVTAISAGALHTVALKSDGTVAAWGYDSNGEVTGLPHDPFRNQRNVTSNPVILNGVVLSDVTAIDAGQHFTAALRSDGTVVVWGGFGPFSIETPIPAGLSGVTAISAGTGHIVALKSDGTVVAWGSNSSGQTNVPAGLSGVTAIAAGHRHTVVLKGDGTVVMWGDNSRGQLSTGPGGPLSGVTAIAAGFDHSLALKSNGTVKAWGEGSYGLNNVPAGLSGVTGVATGDAHNVALRSDGTVVAWGAVGNDEGQATVPAGLSGVTAIAAGAVHTVALVAPNTPAGSAVAVAPTDHTTGTSPIAMTFNTITQAGQTSLTTTSDGPAIPAGFVLGDPPTYYNIQTTAIYSGSIGVCVDFSNVSFPPEATLRLLHFESGAWQDVTTSGPSGNIICGTVSSLSPFVVVRAPDTTPPVLQVTMTPNVIWPANKKMVQVTAQIQVSDNRDPNPRVELVSITCNETLGEGDIQGAAFNSDDRSFQLRATRAGNGPGRTYIITYRARDASGNVTLRTSTVVVPHDQGH